MANRFWVGGTASWDATAGTKWSLTDGGAGGEAVPTSSDDVYFTAASGAVTVTIASGTRSCANLTFTGFTGTLTGSGVPIIDFYGSAVLSATMTVNSSVGPFFRKFGATTGTFTSAGKTIRSFELGSASTLSLSDAMVSAGAVTVTQGTFTTNDYNVTATSLSSSNSNTRTINLGSSTVTLTLGSPILFTTATNLTFNAGTSNIICSSTSGTFAGGGQTFYNVSFTSTAISTFTVSGINTFNNLTVAGRASAGINAFSMSEGQTINGTLTLSAGTNATMRTFVRSGTIGTTRTLTCAAVASLTDIDFRDITIAGAAAPVSGTRLGDCKGNSGITFDAAKTVYWRPIGSAFWGATTSSWALSVGGTATHGAFPLAQDIAVIPDAPYPASGSIVTVNANYNIGTIDMSARTSNTLTLATSTNTPAIYGNWINGTGTTLSGTGTMTFAGRGSQTITSAGRTFTQGFIIATPGGSVTLQDAFVTNRAVANAIVLTGGTFAANGYNVTAQGFDTNANTARTVDIGSGTWTLSGTTAPWNASVSSGLTVAGTGTISLTSASAKTFEGGGIQTYPTVNQGGTGTLTINNSNKFANITDTAIGRVQFTGGTTNIFDAFNLGGTVGNLLQLGSTNTTQAILQKSTAWLMGANSTDGGNNTGLSFTAGGGIDYLSVSYINGTVVAPFIAAFIIESSVANSSESSLATLNISLSETSTAADVQAANAQLFSTLSESATIADAVSALKLYIASVAEAATSSDLLSASLTLSASIAELTAGSDATAVSSRVSFPQVSELAAMADSASGGLFFLSSISEATTAQEIATAVLIFNRAVSEATTASELVAAVAAFNAAVPESVTGADVANALVTFGGAVSEALTALDSVLGLKTARTNIAEAATASESSTNVYTANPAIAEAASPLDAVQVVASTFGASSTETARPLDTPQAANTGSSSLSESATASEAQAAQFIAATAVAEASTAQETAAAIQLFVTQVAETAIPADSTSVAPSTFGAIALAAAQAAESFSPAGSVYNAALPVESAGITDSLIGAFLWNDVDDTQIPSWNNVNNTQTPAWASVDDTQSVNWQNVGTTQTPGWTDVDDTQTPGWNPITPQG
jgi:fibronectin-binding autotransporter adhesin